MLAVMFSWMAHGHINSFLELAKSLTTSISDVQVVVHLMSMPANLTPLARDQTDKIKRGAPTYWRSRTSRPRCTAPSDS